MYRYNSTIFLKNFKYNVPRTNFVGVNPFCIKLFRYINMTVLLLIEH